VTMRISTESPEPSKVVTQQTSAEKTFVIRGLEGDRAAWHIILIQHEKLFALQQTSTEPFMQVEDFGRNIQFRDRAGRVRQASGYGTEPPEQLVSWIDEQYGEIL
jgi:hypothetical protein